MPPNEHYPRMCASPDGHCDDCATPVHGHIRLETHTSRLPYTVSRHAQPHVVVTLAPERPHSHAAARHPSVQQQSSTPHVDVHNATPAPTGQRRGHIYLVGAGPGDPDLLTIAAYKAIQKADLVVSDRLIPEPILNLVESQLMVARKVPGRADEAQDELNTWCIDALREGKTVVRLKIGDPFLFGRGGEEVLFFRQHGYECTVVPGVSSSLSAPLMAGIPPTHRGIADQVLIVTGQGRGGSTPELPPYSANRTTVFLMAVGRLPALTSALVSTAGFPSDCPAAVVENATLPNQRAVFGDLSTIARISADAGIKPPACFIVGNVVQVLQSGSPVLDDVLRTAAATPDHMTVLAASTAVMESMPQQYCTPRPKADYITPAERQQGARSPVTRHRLPNIYKTLTRPVPHDSGNNQISWDKFVEVHTGRRRTSSCSS